MNGDMQEVDSAEAKQNLTLRWPPEVYVAFCAAARGERRTKSAMSEIIIEEWLKSHGYLPNAATDTAP